MLYRQSVLSLYKGEHKISLNFNKFIDFNNSEFLRYSKNLQHTDKEYFLRKVKEEFVKNKELAEKDIPYCIKQGKVFLMSRNVQ